MDQFTRGTTIRIRAQFVNPDGVIIDPLGGAAVSLNYTLGRKRAVFEAELEAAGDYWTYVWDSRHASPGMVYGRAYTLGSAPVAAQNFVFRLVGNDANQID